MAKKYLYNAGDECTDLTGGWGSDGYTQTYDIVDWTKNSTNMSATGTTNKFTLVGTIKAVDLSKYSTLNVTLETKSSSTSTNGFGIYISETADLTDVTQIVGFSIVSKTTESIDIENFDGDYYIAFIVHGSTAYSGIVYEVWLEGETERIFQSGIVGKTNVVEGAVISIKKDLVLYTGTDSGEEYYSAGWQYKAGTSSGSYTNFTYSEESLYGATTTSTAGARFVQFDEEIDFSQYKTIKVLAVLNNSSSTETCVQIHTDYTTSYGTPSVESSTKPTASSVAQEVAFDISDVSVVGYLAVRTKMSGCSIQKVWLEP